jgi:nitrogen fixation/metabolism regulation signal transduction histidine kinase
MIALIVISLIITGVSTIYFFKNQNDVYHLGRLQRKEQSIMLALKYFVIEESIDEVNLKLNKKLDELTNIHGLDLNLYNEYGGLVYTTILDETKEILAQENISSAIIDSVAHTNDPVIVEEKWDDQNYLSTYFMIQNRKNLPIAVVNIPYHKDHKRSSEELSAFLHTLVQVFLLLFVGASVIAYFLSNYITKSLQAVSEGIKQTQLAGENPHIEWDSDDEIGELVKDYNRMVDELQDSADLLAKSERESAWKEMARQVAHEIKNPLTPMRLNIQHLQRSITDNPNEIQERIDKFTRVMLEQIDTLSRIASEFSNFAKMPKTVLENLNLSDTLNSAVELYSNTPHVEVLFQNHINDKIELEADRKQLIRAISNLIKNGIQSIPSGRMGKIMVILYRKDERIHIDITDNGKGIPIEERDKIFEPYFTTKSGGTGLGLALVKNIFNEFGADIRFESEINEGTIFTIWFILPV